jgi:hypothetical protein
MAFETIDFTTPDPVLTPHLSMPSYKGAAYDSDAGCWALQRSGGGMLEFYLALAKHQRASLVVTGYTSDDKTRITITCNGSHVVHDKPLNQTPNTPWTWYLSSDLTSPEPDNVLEIRARAGNTVYIESVSVQIFEMEKQQEDNWCWAAVGASVAAYYSPGNSPTQCELANVLLGQSTCCQHGGSSDCNQPNYLSTVLQQIGNYAGTTGVVALDQVAGQVIDGRPLCVFIKWHGKTTGHFVGLTGTNQIHNMLAIQDPWYGTCYMKYSDLENRYQAGWSSKGGKWVDSYYTSAST